MLAVNQKKKKSKLIHRYKPQLCVFKVHNNNKFANDHAMAPSQAAHLVQIKQCTIWGPAPSSRH